VTNNVRQARRHADLTQQELADAVGVSRQTIISVEQGRYRPSVELALKMGRTLDLPVEKLFILEAE
jgi:putative transcriptional regulator